METFPRYTEYKDSGVKWLEQIPRTWELKPFKFIFKSIESGMREQTDEKDVISIGGEHLYNGKINYVNLKYVSEKFYRRMTKGKVGKGDILVVKDGATIGKTAYVDNLPDEPIVINEHIYRIEAEKYFYYYLISSYAQYYFRSRNNSSAQEGLPLSTINNLKCPYPNKKDQEKIVIFLDHKTAEIDTEISKKQRLIELLEERKNILINQAVTKGLNPDVPMKDSGVDWIGEIPEHWFVRRAKYSFIEIDERSVTGEEELLSVSHITGVTPRSEKNVNMFLAEDYSGSKICKDGDLVINIMWAWMGALGVSDRIGIVSPSYGVYRQKNENTFDNWFLEHLLRSNEYVAEYNRRSTGLHSSRLRLYSNMFLDMKISFPPYDEQVWIRKAISKKTSFINAYIKKIRTQIEKLFELRSILITNAVTGKIKI